MILHDGLWWPDADSTGRAIITSEVSLLSVAMSYCPKRELAVQAGGNVGTYPVRMAQEGFENIISFEPSRENFECLLRNVAPYDAILAVFGALGNSREPVGFDPVWAGNCGAGQVRGSGTIPQFRIDDLCLGECDLIQLDVEGYERHVLEGARETIIRCSPLLLVEDRGHMGSKVGALPKWICETFGYVKIRDLASDVLLGKPGIHQRDTGAIG